VLKWGPGFINAVGLANPGVDAEVRILQDTKRRLEALAEDHMRPALIASIFAESVEGFAYVADRVTAAQPDLIEVNISCPNLGHELGMPFAAYPETAAMVTAAVKAATDIPVIVKLSPNVTDIAAIARAVAEAGADAIAAINTVAGMVIDVHLAYPILANLEGGLSGPAIKPIAVRCIWQIHQAVPHVPIVGIGGVSSGEDAAELLMAGATAVGVGSAVYYRGVDTLGQIAHELTDFMVAESYASVRHLVGLAHRAQPVSRIPSPPVVES